jgi:hypothetical protein
MDYLLLEIPDKSHNDVMKIFLPSPFNKSLSIAQNENRSLGNALS